MPPANKTIWTKQSAALLINIVKDVELKILGKQLQVGKENEKTKWDYVAALLHEASESDASKTSTNCQYKFWELNRQYKLLVKEAGGRSISEEKEAAIYSALKEYHARFPSINKTSKRQREKNAFVRKSGIEHGQLMTNESPERGIDVQSTDVVPISACNEGRDDSEDESGDSLHELTNVELTGELVMSGQAVQQSEDEGGGGPYHYVNEEPSEQLGASCALRDRRHAKSGKRKASDEESLDLEFSPALDTRHEEDSSHRIKQMVDKMARLTSYLNWKQTGVGEDWKCDITDRIERRLKRNMKRPNSEPNQVQIGTESQVPDEIETALREDILAYWNELDKKRPTEDECETYFLKKSAGELRY